MDVLLIAGMGIWLFIVYRGLRAALKAESDRGGLTHLLLYAAAAIPVFYCFALFVNRNSHITMADYWRWWLIHLWVEGMFEVFAVVVIGFLMVRLGLVTAQSTLRATVLPADHPAGQRHHRHRPPLLLDRRARSLDGARSGLLRPRSDSAVAADGGGVRAVQGDPARAASSSRTRPRSGSWWRRRSGTCSARACSDS